MDEPPRALDLPPGIPAPGETFAGKYRIEGVLGVGGMGAVLAAVHIHLDERVAIKVMLPDAQADGATSVRFLREARAAVKIKSEHVAKVLDFGQLEDGQPYIVMEYLTGEDLGAAVDRRGPLPIAEVVDFLLQACDAVAQAHALGIVHRDLKPSNLFLAERPDGTRTIKVLDFGISKAVARSGPLESLTLTKTQAVVGSPMYMAPEQMRPNHPVDARTDVWSFGIVAYELLTGKLPFEARTMPELCAMVLQDEPDPPSARRAEIPSALDAAVLRCLAKKPADRFPDLTELAAAFTPFGPPGAAARLERIQRSSGVRIDERSRLGLTASLSGGSSGRLADAPTAQAWTDASIPAPVPRRRWAWLAGGLGVLACAGFVGIASRRVEPQPPATKPPSSGVAPYPTPPSSEPSPSAQTSGGSAATPPIPPATASTNPPAPSATGEPSARAPSPTARHPPPRPPPKPSSAAPASPSPSPSTGRTNSRYD